MDRFDELRPEWRTTPKPERLEPDDAAFEPAMRAHRAAMTAGQDGYIDPTSGLFVMTAEYLRTRGRCCACRCRHCPYI